ncbi:hypothetical protein [Acetobacter pasteurianus]|nr:hypothetical protein [Acetobacter pasteurianus]QHM90358.1 hypothetical protein FCN51_01840 [Acetobacter pasteurianus]
MRWLTSADHHYYHQAVITYSKRPFSSLDHMHEVFIRRWNSTVEDDDRVIYVGDLIFGNDISILKELRGHIIVNTGNHDKHSAMNKALRQGYVQSVQSYTGLYLAGQNYHFQHFPALDWPGKDKGAILVHGHMHNKYPPTEQSIDVGVDTPWANFAPIPIERIPSLIRKYGPKVSSS